VITQDYELPLPWPSIPHLLADRAARFPERWLIARRERLAGGGTGDWQGLSYGEVLRQARAAARWLIEHGYGPDKGIAVLSGPSPQHLVLMYAAQMARALYVPVSVNFSLGDGAFYKLSHVLDICTPALVFAEDGGAITHALRAIRGRIEHVVVAGKPGDGDVSFADLIAHDGGEEVDRTIAAITPDTLAKVIFTSGSTGMPKAVMHTQRVMVAVIQEHDALYLRDEDPAEPAQVLGWMAWSHTGPSNVTLSDVLNDGATFYIDDGAPIEGKFEETIRNLREIHPADYGSAPIFFAHLVRAMDGDTALRDAFFSKLRHLTYATAGLSQDVFDRIQVHALAATGRKIPIITKYGTTETQGLTLTSWPVERIGPIGLPFPGIAMKLAPKGDKLEIRAKGDAITPGYYRDPAATAAAFDEEGFYCTGDAAVLVDPEDPAKGIAFDGRVAENFKMSSGTWVSVGNLRLDLLAALKPDAAEVVIVGENRDWLGIMIWLPGGGSPDDVQRARIEEALRRFNGIAGGLSRRIARAIFVTEPLSGDEVTEKGTVNQRAVQRNRPALVEALHVRQPATDVLVIEPAA
jgi:feruloyl-CoA synthase